MFDTSTSAGGSRGLFWMGIFILGSFALMVYSVLVGCFLMLAGYIAPKDVSIVAVTTTLIGTVVGYMSANASQVIGYFYGTSKSSADKTIAMANASRAQTPIPFAGESTTTTTTNTESCVECATKTT